MLLVLIITHKRGNIEYCRIVFFFCLFTLNFRAIPCVRAQRVCVCLGVNVPIDCWNMSEGIVGSQPRPPLPFIYRLKMIYLKIVAVSTVSRITGRGDRDRKGFMKLARGRLWLQHTQSAVYV